MSECLTKGQIGVGIGRKRLEYALHMVGTRTLHIKGAVLDTILYDALPILKSLCIIAANAETIPRTRNISQKGLILLM